MATISTYMVLVVLSRNKSFCEFVKRSHKNDYCLSLTQDSSGSVNFIEKSDHSNKRKDTKYSKSRSPIMQSLNPTQLQPPSSILKAAADQVRGGAPGVDPSASEATPSSGDNSQWAIWPFFVSSWKYVGSTWKLCPFLYQTNLPIGYNDSYFFMIRHFTVLLVNWISKNL